MNLALKYRPHEFSEVVGQKATAAILSAKIRQGTLDQALLFYGPSGVGKTSMARIVAAALNPESAEDVHNLTHPFVWEIDAASNGSVAAIRDLRERVIYATTAHRVIILDEVHAMSTEAFDALLILLENPPDNTTIILCTTEIQQLKTTIRHRCDKYSFKLASVDELVERLNYVNLQEGYQVDLELLNLIALRSEGSYRESLMLLGQVTSAGVRTLEQFYKLMGEYDIGSVLLQASMAGPESAIEALNTAVYSSNVDEILNSTLETIRDLIVLKSGNKLAYAGSALDIRLELASQLDTFKLVKAIKIFWDLQTKMGKADSLRNLEMAFVLLGDVFKPAVQETVQQSQPQPTKALSFKDMKARQVDTR